MTDCTGTPSRRGLLAAAASGLAVAASAAAAAAPRDVGLAELKKEADIACLYHCDFGDAARFEQMLTNIANHYSAYDADPFALQLAIVAHGAGVKFFLKDLEGTAWAGDAAAMKSFDRVEALAKNGLKVHLCEITFQRNRIDKAKAREAAFASFVPSGVATVAALQAKGFAYMKVG
ncbi:DsrE family protein [Bosea sp. (in: a-proteobacteria)]|uniref:DsrE family protein n=1 Tax=Bosea sp. (in: a-proteobacteria) TaxID=1871050 RepID=UPI001ACF9AA7|nr:DsrE family protein [Bosea sp. (in: a-proteobacteria)]MBN9442736.1 DsrE family protein [Bosea sp. (in: a-proteobacteria)]